MTSAANPVTLSSPSPVRRGKSLYEQVYQALRASILSGELKPGERLVETQIADWLQVSRTPLREALRQLQQDGLVTAESGGGLRVTQISTTDAIDLYECRLALEQVAVAGACHHMTPAQRQQLEACVQEAESLQQTDPAPTHRQLLDLDYRFHRLIAEFSGNKRLVSLLDQIFDAMALLRIQTLQHNPNVLDIRLEHRQILDAIATQDAATATAAIRTHLIASQERVVREIEAFEAEGK